MLLFSKSEKLNLTLLIGRVNAENMVSSTVSVPDRGPTFMAVTGVLSGIAFVLVVYRLLHGWRFRKAIYTDDILIACSMVCFATLMKSIID